MQQSCWRQLLRFSFVSFIWCKYEEMCSLLIMRVSIRLVMVPPGAPGLLVISSSCSYFVVKILLEFLSVFYDYIHNVNLFSRHGDSLGRGALDFHRRKFGLNSTDDVRYLPKSPSCPMSWSQVCGSLYLLVYCPCSWFLFPSRGDVMRRLLLEHMLCGEVLQKLYGALPFAMVVLVRNTA